MPRPAPRRWGLNCIGTAKRVDTPPPNPFSERNADGTCPYETDDCDCYSPQEDGEGGCKKCDRPMRMRECGPSKDA